jgi:hypothetical protein
VRVSRSRYVDSWVVMFETPGSASVAGRRVRGVGVAGAISPRSPPCQMAPRLMIPDAGGNGPTRCPCQIRTVVKNACQHRSTSSAVAPVREHHSHTGLGSRSPGSRSTCSRISVPSMTGSLPRWPSQAPRWVSRGAAGPTPRLPGRAGSRPASPSSCCGPAPGRRRRNTASPESSAPGPCPARTCGRHPLRAGHRTRPQPVADIDRQPDPPVGPGASDQRSRAISTRPALTAS